MPRLDNGALRLAVLAVTEGAVEARSITARGPARQRLLGGARRWYPTEMRTRGVALSLVVVACGASTTPVAGDVPLDDRARPDAAVADVAGDAPGSTEASVDGGVACPGPAPSLPAQVRTERGVVQGEMAEGAWHWLGIPYAEPPTGPLRWRPPVPFGRCWEGVRMATEWAPACPQIPQQQGVPFDPNGPVRGQEDCLTLNVWSPASAARDAGLPVMVFIHGGGNTVGSAGELTQAGQRLFEGARLAARGNVVVVTLQYRLGALGFLAHPALAAETGNVAGNYGLLDQAEALRWVQRNVRAFGGDPSRVMLFGESAGAVDTCMLVASPRATGLFSRALIQSGSCAPARALPNRQAEAERFVTNARCMGNPDLPACLRALGVEDALRAGAAPVDVSGVGGMSSLSWGPTVDGQVLPEAPLARITAGRHNRVALVVGHNTDETSLTVPAIPDENAYRAALVATLGPTLGAATLERYPVARYGSPRAALVQASTDARFGCQARLTARAAFQGQRDLPVYRYLYAQALESAGVPARALGAFHGVELFFVFQGLAGSMRTPTANELAVESALLGYWTRFAATGDPNGAGAPAWPRYGSGEPMLRLQPMPTEERGWRTAECDFFDSATMATLPAP